MSSDLSTASNTEASRITPPTTSTVLAVPNRWAAASADSTGRECCSGPTNPLSYTTPAAAASDSRPDTLNGEYLSHDGCQRASTAPSAEGSAVGASTVLRRVGQQNRPQPGHLAGQDGVQLEDPGPALALGFLAGVHSHHGQAHQAMQQPRIALHRTNPVERHRQYLALQETGPQLQLARLRVGVDAVAGGVPARHADHDGVRQHGHCPGLVAGGRTQHDRADQQWEFAQQFVHRVNQQHPGTQPLPGDLRRPGGRCHVASSAPIAAMSVSCATTWSATSTSSATMCTAPAEEAVVTVTLARPNNWSNGPR